MDRTRRDPDPFLDWKVRIFFAGAALVMAGVVLGQDVLVLIAIILLGTALVGTAILRVRQRRMQAAEVAEEDERVEDDGSHPH